MPKDKDPQSGDITLKASITPSSVELRAKSRFISAIDHFGGSLMEALAAPLARANARSRGEIAVIDAAAAAAVDRIKSSPELADPVVSRHFDAEARRLARKSSVVVAAIEDLRGRPPTDEEAQSGPETLAPEFLDRWERYAEDASTDELRYKWGKVLAAEVRKPGRVSRRTMRTIDELPPQMALKFEQMCKMRLDHHLLEFLTDELSFEETATLAFYDLIIEPPIKGLLCQFYSAPLDEPRWIFAGGGGRYVALPKREPLFAPGSKVLTLANGIPAMGTYVLTDVGFEIASIFDDTTETPWQLLIAALCKEAQSVGGYDIMEYRAGADGAVITTVHSGKPEPDRAPETKLALG